MARKKMCPYCLDDGSGNIPEEHKDLFFDDVGEIAGIPITAEVAVGTLTEKYLYFSVWLDVDSGKDTFLIHGKTVDGLTIPINYCPMCGRKL